MNNLIPLKFYLINQKGGKANSTFIPYEEHHLMSQTKRISEPTYCPDTHPFLCNKETLGNGFCKQRDYECNTNIKGKLPINYHP